MENEYQELLRIVSNRYTSAKERLNASIGIWRAITRIRGQEVRPVYLRFVRAWRTLANLERDRNDRRLFLTRKQIARYCGYLSRRLPEGQKFFCYFPRIELAEGPMDSDQDRIMRGPIKPCVYSSIYEFHYEYPIEGRGVRKDRISVITELGDQVPLLDWCKDHEIIVYCGRCGLDITFVAAMNCPFKRQEVHTLLILLDNRVLN